MTSTMTPQQEMKQGIVMEINQCETEAAFEALHASIQEDLGIKTSLWYSRGKVETRRKNALAWADEYFDVPTDEHTGSIGDVDETVADDETGGDDEQTDGGATPTDDEDEDESPKSDDDDESSDDEEPTYRVTHIRTKEVETGHTMSDLIERFGDLDYSMFINRGLTINATYSIRGE